MGILNFSPLGQGSLAPIVDQSVLRKPHRPGVLLLSDHVSRVQIPNGNPTPCQQLQHCFQTHSSPYAGTEPLSRLCPYYSCATCFINFKRRIATRPRLLPICMSNGPKSSAPASIDTDAASIWIIGTRLGGIRMQTTSLVLSSRRVYSEPVLALLERILIYYATVSYRGECELVWHHNKSAGPCLHASTIIFLDSRRRFTGSNREANVRNMRKISRST